MRSIETMWSIVQAGREEQKWEGIYKMEYNMVKERLVSRNKVVKKHQVSVPHCHDTYELYYMLKGRTTYFIEDKIYSVDTGNLVFVLRRVIHNTDNENCKTNERLLVSFEEKLFEGKAGDLKEQLMPLRIICIPDDYLPAVEELLYKIEAEYAQHEKGRELLLELYIQQLLVLICRYRCERKVHIRESDKIIYTVSDYIRLHFEQDITLEILSRMFAVSEGYLSRKFKQVTGMGLNQYITLVRISNGEKLLRESNLNVTEVAERCGYNDSNYFAAVFKRVKGVTPLRYRKQS